MSQMVTRKGPVGEDKEKRQTDSPVKDMKKKIAANAEKEKQAAEKTTEKSVANEKQVEKTDKAGEKKEKEKSVEKVDKKEKEKVVEKDKKEKEKVVEKDKKEKEKSNDKGEKKDKNVEKKDKPVEKSPEKKEKVEKKEPQAEKAKDDGKDKTVKADSTENKKKQEEKKQNGAKVNGDQNGDTVSSEDEDLDMERDEMFPELAYEDSDGEGFERPTPEGLPSRSYTRRSQSKEKILKLKEGLQTTDRKLRSADSPKPDKESPKKLEEVPEKEGEGRDVDIEVVIEVDHDDEVRTKPDTNYSRSRVKVSPYRRSMRLADVTCSSTAANYTGNNTTMEMDITETSSYVEETPESPYLSGLRNIRGRRSYRPLAEMNLRNIVNRSQRPAGLAANEPVRPTGTVVGRKRKPESDGPAETNDATGGEDVVGSGAGDTKRPRLLQRLARPFRTLATPRHAEIVGINTDLPLTAPVACSDGFDPEAIKTEAGVEATTLLPAPALALDRHADNKRCVIV